MPTAQQGRGAGGAVRRGAVPVPGPGVLGAAHRGQVAVAGVQQLVDQAVEAGLALGVVVLADLRAHGAEPGRAASVQALLKQEARARVELGAGSL